MAEPPAPAAKGAKAAPAAKGAKAAPAPAGRTVAKREEAEPPPPPPPPPAAKPAAGGCDPVDEALGLCSSAGGGGGGAAAKAPAGKSAVYVPPKPGGGADLPDTVTDGQVTEGIKGKFDSLAACGETHAGVEGVVVMRWSITAEGGARDIKCAAPCASQPLAGCLGSVIKGIRFPRSANGRTRVEFPFKF
jgi:hypothetical protein